MIQHEFFRVVSRFPCYSTFQVISQKVEFLWDSVNSQLVMAVSLNEAKKFLKFEGGIICFFNV